MDPNLERSLLILYGVIRRKKSAKFVRAVLIDFYGINFEAGKSVNYLVFVQGLDPDTGGIQIQLRRKTVGIYNSDSCADQTIALILESRYGK
jgi:hypothetical protein